MSAAIGALAARRRHAKPKDLAMNIKLTMLAAAAVGIATIGSANAMPLTGLKAMQNQSLVQDVRIVCNSRGICWNTNNPRRTWRSSRSNRRYVQPHYGYQPYYGNQYGYGYRAPRAGITVGPFGIYAR
jgi:hypothetical protein